jgi:hypothetical protein
MVDAVSLEIILPLNRVIIADIHGEQYRMLRLFGLFVCVSFAFIFPQYAYVETLETLILNIITTAVFAGTIMILIQK